MSTETIYELKSHFPYALKGDMQDATFITLTAPTFKQVKHVAPIKQAFMAAIAEVTDTVLASEGDIKDADSDTDIDGDQVIQLMLRWSGDIRKVFDNAKGLFKSGAALVDGETTLTADLMDKMSLEDFEGLVGAYIANFITPSLMGGATGNTG